jgi:regulator of protease activity HflC (stomatin/prohibitin superfamily)
MSGEGKIIGLIFLGIAMLVGIGMLFSLFYIVDAGERAVLLTWGKASSNSYGPGLHFKIPIAQDAVKFDIKTQKYEAEASAASKDLQTVTTKMAINYRLLPETVPSMYSTVGTDYSSRIIQPLEQEIVKATTSKYTAEELIIKREEVREDIKNTMKERLAPRGIIVEEVSIVNFDFSPSFNSAIEAKVTAEQSALAAKNKLEQVKFEALQKVESAKAEAESLRLQKQEVTPELIRLREIEVQRIAVEKWNGQLPSVTGGAMPFIDVNKYQGVTQ